MDGTIGYNDGPLLAYETTVGTTVGQLTEGKDNIQHRLQALEPFFQGHGASGFFDAEQMWIKGREEQIEGVQNYGRAVTAARESAHTTDQEIGAGF